MELRFGEISIKPSSVDRVVFPDAGLTKGDVILFYRDIAPLILPELRGRPLTVERFNKGIGADGKTSGFYQKHAQKFFPPWLDRITVAAKKPSVQPVVNTVAGLVVVPSTRRRPIARSARSPAAAPRSYVRGDPTS